VSHPSRQSELAWAFLHAAFDYWIMVLPIARHELRHLRERAAAIPDPVLRRHALGIYETDWASLEGVAAFAAFTPPTRRATVVRLLIALQSIYQYADTLMEQPCGEPAANARALHAAMLAALQPDSPQPDYYAHNDRDQDGGYLAGLVQLCRSLVVQLPSYALVREQLLGQVKRIVFYQAEINLAAAGHLHVLEQWAAREAPSGGAQRWWELAAAAGSSLATLALLAAAADPTLTIRRAHAIEALYWPRVGALHTLLDSLVDRAEDAATGQHNLLDHYSTTVEMAAGMERLALEATRQAEALGVEHRLILAGVACLYTSDRQAWLPDVRPATERVLVALEGLARPAMLLLCARRFIHRESEADTGWRGVLGCGKSQGTSARARRARRSGRTIRFRIPKKGLLP
jgi:tetraprenyl-beta-curcumene synthase